MSEEFEVTLKVCARDPDDLFSRVFAMRSLGPFDLAPGGTSEICDEYFDTDARDLMKKGFALRLRTEGGRTLLCLKGRERINERGVIGRLEIEGPFSEETMGRVIAEAEMPSWKHGPFHHEDPGATLREMGLQTIQSRTMTRQRLSVLPASGPQYRPVGEIDLDKIGYRIAGIVFVHYEIEIEAASKNRRETILDLANLMREAFPGSLRRWDHNKLITGLALEDLVRLNRIRPSSGNKEVISEEIYGKIEDWIGKHRAVSGKPDDTQG